MLFCRQLAIRCLAPSVLVCLAAGFSAPPVMGTPDPRTVAHALQEQVRRIEARYRSLGAFRLEVETRYDSRTFGDEEVHKAVLHVVPPEHLRFDYSQPAGDWAVFDGQAWWLVSVDDREITRHERQKGDLLPLVDLVSGKLDLLRVFSLRFSPDLPRDEGRTRLELIPRVPRDEIERVVLECDGDTGTVHLIEVEDPIGGRTIWRLSEPVHEKPLPASSFRVIVPEGYLLSEN